MAGPLEDAIAAYARNDFATTLRLVTPLAERGDGDAEYRLGLLYANGQGVGRDYVLAYMWWTLADLNGDSEAIYARDDIETVMSLAELKEAQRLASDWRAKPER
jgi:TPR repeat protein